MITILRTLCWERHDVKRYKMFLTSAKFTKTFGRAFRTYPSPFLEYTITYFVQTRLVTRLVRLKVVDSPVAADEDSHENVWGQRVVVLASDC